SKKWTAGWRRRSASVAAYFQPGGRCADIVSAPLYFMEWGRRSVARRCTSCFRRVGNHRPAAFQPAGCRIDPPAHNRAKGIMGLCLTLEAHDLRAAGGHGRKGSGAKTEE